MGKEKEGYKVPDSKKKTCPYCGERISKQGWKMHYNFKHPKEEFVPFEEASGGKSTPQKLKSPKKEESGDNSFREGESGESGEGSDSDREFWGED